MQVSIIATLNGIPDLKLIAESEAEQNYLLQLADAGTLTSMIKSTGLSVVFRAVSVMEEDYATNTSSSTSSIGRYNFEVRQNETKSFDFTFSTPESPINLNIYTGIELQIKNRQSGSAVISLSIGAGLQILGDANNVLRVVLTAAQTKLLELPQYCYDVLFKSPGSNVYQVEGIITVMPSVSR
jgi:hypothetical protein